VAGGAQAGPRHAWRHELAGNSIFHRYVGAEPEQEAVRALAIDGGGIRGLLPCLIGAEIEDRTGKRIADLFDFVVGTSTGSILALGAATPGEDGRPKWTARDGANLYINRGHEFFDRGHFSIGAFHEKYRHQSFERALDDNWGDIRLSDAIIDCMATSYELTRRTVHHFDSRMAKKDPSFDFPMKTAIRAATAAPTFFEPVQAHSLEEHHLLIDGAVYANNPAMIAFTEIQRMGPTDMMLVSLGTGDESEGMHWELIKDWGFAQWARPILNVVFDAASESVDYQLRHLLGPERYHRFQVPIDGSTHRLDDASPANIQRLITHAEHMIAEHHAELDDLCEKLDR
jgi:patatin-like phospholipase/acyl hydrolase